MRFTKDQYDKAIQSLKDASEQLNPDGRCCTCCGDDGHAAFECGFNPLVAMEICAHLTKRSHALHETLHRLAGYDTYMGNVRGPAKVRLPQGNEVGKGETA